MQPRKHVPGKRGNEQRGGQLVCWPCSQTIADKSIHTNPGLHRYGAWIIPTRALQSLANCVRLDSRYNTPQLNLREKRRPHRVGFRFRPMPSFEIIR